MKILKPGSGQRGWSVEATCTGAGNDEGGCLALLLVEQGDLFVTFINCRDESERFVTFKCGACGVLTDLTRKSLPPAAIASNLPTQRHWESNR